MINAAIFQKTIRDSLVTVGLASVGIVGFVVLLAPVFLSMGAELLEFVAKVGFIKKIFEATLGIKVEGEVSINMLFGIGFTHGTVLMLTWGTLIATTTRVIAGEIERGTADLLLSLPASRSEVYLSITLGWLVSATVLSACPIVGVFIGSLIIQTDEVVDIRRYLAPTINFFAINVAIASMSCLISSAINRRALAVGCVVAVAFLSTVLNFLEPFLDWVSRIRFIGLLNYYRPVDIIRTGQWPVSSIIVLLTFALGCWLVGLVVFNRKDIPTA